jgi:uncharacterized protein YjbI with pentapeptide repeats
MAIATPAFAIVRPRVVVTRTGQSLSAEDAVAELFEEYGSGFVQLSGGPGTGKTTALAHLAAVFAHEERFVFLDEPTPEQVRAAAGDSFVVMSAAGRADRNMELALQPWSRDELIEYLLSEHHDDCGSVISRLAAAAKWRWCPQLARLVMDRFASDYELHDVTDAIVIHFGELLTGPKQRAAATQFALAVLVGGTDNIVKANEALKQSLCSADAIALLRHRLVQLPLAASRIIGLLHNGHFTDLEKKLPFELVELLGWQCAANATAADQLRKALALRRAQPAHATAASILLIADPTWRPERPRQPWQLTHGVFRNAEWEGANFFRARLDHCDFSDANLESAEFETADLSNSNFRGAKLRGAKMFRARAVKACFDAADLRQAKLSSATLTGADLGNADLREASLIMAELGSANLAEATLRKADLSQARMVEAILHETDLSGANLTQANLSKVDLRTAILNGACFEKANLSHAQLEDVQLVHAQFRGADLRSSHLTGSAFPSADLRDADLRSAGLAEVDWEEADLRGANLTGATFHMGSSRSGLVNSPYACEGSKTGFYTDDLEDLTFKRPEEVRKANLRGADLRNVKAEGVDFYLVDLREAKLDRKLRDQAAQTGAIVDDFED